MTMTTGRQTKAPGPNRCFLGERASPRVERSAPPPWLVLGFRLYNDVRDTHPLFDPRLLLLLDVLYSEDAFVPQLRIGHHPAQSLGLAYEVGVSSVEIAEGMW